MELQPIFYDFEASGFTGFPIEIGWAWLDGASVKSDSLLIRPMTNWDIDANWDAQAQSIHGISVTQLKEEGFPTAEVAQRLNYALRGRTLYSDSAFDIKWMGQLFTAAGVSSRFKLHRMPAPELIDDLRMRLALPKRVASQIAQSVDRQFPHTHHARDDALYWAQLWANFSQAGDRVKSNVR
jgi:hypothetical protein